MEKHILVTNDDGVLAPRLMPVMARRPIALPWLPLDILKNRLTWWSPGSMLGPTWAMT
jgi:hypothetical protein